MAGVCPTISGSIVRLTAKISETLNIIIRHHGAPMSYESILQELVRRLTYYIEGKNKTLEFDIPPLSLRRNDRIQSREKILAITPEERKRLGINKSTLWYTRRSAEKSEKRKIYAKVLSKLP